MDLHPDSVIGIDRNWTISYTNAAANQLIPNRGLVHEVDYWNYFLDSRPNDSPLWGHFQRAMHHGIAADFVEVYSQKTNRWMRIAVRPVASGIVVILRDISIEKQAMKAIEQSEKLASLGRMISSITHEICNPLEAIANLLYLIRTDAGSRNHEKYISLAEQELTRAAVIARQTLGFARNRNRPSRVSCDDLVKNVLSLLNSRIAAANIHVDTDALNHAPVLCYEGEVQQILNNLIVNAIEAMPPEGGRLILRSRSSSRKAGRGVLVTIADTGAGMSAHTVARSFAPFFTTKGEKGNGLGLWICREIAGRHGGTLKLRTCQQRGRTGSVFQLFLPLEPSFFPVTNHPA